MKLIGPSSVLVRWDDQVADSFTLHLHLDIRTLRINDIAGTSYTFTEVPASSQYLFHMWAVFAGRSGDSSNNVIITPDCKYL